MPGAYYAGQSELAWREGRYGYSVTLYAAALADAAVGVATFGQTSAVFGAVRTTTIVVAREVQQGAAVLGHFPAYVNQAERIGARYFNVPPEVWARMSPAEQWAANQKFLDRLIKRGGEIILATPATAARPGSFFARELEYLTSQGYSLSVDGARLLPPIR